MHQINVQIGAPAPSPEFLALCSGNTPEESINLFFHAVASSDDMVASLFKYIEATLSPRSTLPDRPFDGQPHTHQGERGKQPVSGLNMRDLADCLVRAIAHSANDQLSEEAYKRVDQNLFTYRELYELDLNQTDPVAIIQNMCVEVEKVMGIYPNVPELRFIGEEKED